MQQNMTVVKKIDHDVF